MAASGIGKLRPAHLLPTATCSSSGSTRRLLPVQLARLTGNPVASSSNVVAPVVQAEAFSLSVGRDLSRSPAAARAALLRRADAQGLGTLAALADCLTWRPYAPAQVLPSLGPRSTHPISWFRSHCSAVSAAWRACQGSLMDSQGRPALLQACRFQDRGCAVQPEFCSAGALLCRWCA